MNPSEIATVLYTGMGLLALWFTLVCWREYATDKFRQDIFDLRAELFDYATRGEVSFDNHSYVRLRKLFNSMIRFAHEISFTRLAATVALERFRPCFRSFPNLVDEIRNDQNLSNDAKDKLETFHLRLSKLVLVQIVCTSVAALPLLIVYVLYGVVRYGVPKRPVETTSVQTPDVLRDPRLNHHIRMIEQQAVETREIEMADAARA